MNKTLFLPLSIFMQGLIFLVLGSLGILPIYNMATPIGIVNLMLWFLVFSSIFVWSGKDLKSSAISGLICLIIWVVIETLTELFLIPMLYEISELLGYIFYAVQSILCLESVFHVAQYKNKKNGNTNPLFLIGTVLAAIIYILMIIHFINVLPEYNTSSSLFSLLTENSLPRYEASKKALAIFYSVAGSFLALYHTNRK
ncbi:hypothetical protein SAMN02910275_00717 [Butyrivibrio sp. INlla18]|uniref:hypothetical protein n=1 Tax=Butyrivibrio sp. INlla18 TaxID=1520806 RepID=UPI000887B7DC|nr:hypothetical protein [Butyrivibrio sp. INlla18]SDA48101.1 hypothetical protein SAMN02910275_00717 [Butyrivibrio sp. INlla18]